MNWLWFLPLVFNGIQEYGWIHQGKTGLFERGMVEAFWAA
jgi:hypothetical protein